MSMIPMGQVPHHIADRRPDIVHRITPILLLIIHENGIIEKINYYKKMTKKTGADHTDSPRWIPLMTVNVSKDRMERLRPLAPLNFLT